MECGFINHFVPWVFFFILVYGMGIVVQLVAIFVGPGSIFYTISYLAYILFCALAYVVYILLRTVTRVNLRRMWSIGDPAVNFFDVFLVCCPCTSPCELCQEVRSVNISGWDWFSQLRTKGFIMSSGGFQLLRAPGTPAHKEGFQGSYQNPPGYYAPPHQPSMKEEHY